MNENLSPIVLDPSVITYEVTADTIQAMKSEAAGLVIAGIEDKEGYRRVETSRKAVKNLRISIEKRRKELKEGALNFGREVDARAAVLTGELSTIETTLAQKSAAIDAEKERIAREKEEAARLKLKDRHARMIAVTIDGTWMFKIDPATATDQEFEAAFAEQKEFFDAEAKRRREEVERKVAEAKAKDEELERLRAEAARAHAEAVAIAEQHAAQMRQIQAEAEAKAKAEREAIELKAAEERRIQAEKDRLVKEENDRKLAEARAEAEKLRREKEKREYEEMMREMAQKQKEFEEKQAKEEAEREKIRLQNLDAVRAERMRDIQAKFPTLDLCWLEIYRLCEDQFSL